MLRHVLQLYWEARNLGVEAYATELAAFLDRLAEVDASMVSWYGDDGSPVTKAPVADVTVLIAHLHAHPEHWVHGDRRFSAFIGNFDNGRRGQRAVQLSIKCGINQASSTIWFPNYLTLRFRPSPQPGEFLDLATTDALFRCAAEIFRPRWGALGPEGFPQRSLDEEFAGTPLVTSRLHLAPSYPFPIELEPPSRITRFEDGTALISVVPGWLDPDNPEHQSAWRRAKAALEAAGSLVPQADEPASPV